jgi:H+/Cl- antiporter ClcA/septal ring-binding cell division protein DamX
VFAGLIGALFHTLLDRAASVRGTVHELLSAAPVPGWLLLMLLGALALVCAMWLVRRFAPETAGSGVQEVEAILAGERKLRWRRVLPVKFFAGTLAVGSGLVLGREGPTIHMGAALGQLASERLAPRPGDNHALIAAGAGAGLATAFNAPLAAIIFVIEELREHFDYRFATVQSVILACCASVIVSDWMLGKGPDMPLPDLDMAPLASLPLFPLLGVLIGALGVLFNRLILGSVAAFRALGSAGAYAAAGVTGLILGALIWFAPNTVGGGEGLVERLPHVQPPLLLLLALIAVRLLTTVGSYGVGLPGGIFAPMLALGTVCGAAFAALVSTVAPALVIVPEVFAVAAMGALFAATVRAPLTGIILVIELTGAHALVLPIILTCLSATFAAQAMGGRPIYSSLLGLGTHPPPRAPVRRIGAAAMILVAFIAIEQIDVAWQGDGMKPIETLAETHTRAPVVAEKPAPVTSIPGYETEATASSPPVPTLEEALPRATAPEGAEPTGKARPDRVKRASAAADDRTGAPAATSLPAQEAPTDVGHAEQLPSRNESASEPAPEPSVGSARPDQAPQTDEEPVTRPTTATMASSDHTDAVPVEARYSIQLISFREKASLARFARDEGLIGKTYQLESMGPPARWHAVLLGAFKDRAAAETALEDLPARLRRLSPFVRHLTSGERLVTIRKP